MNTSLYQVKVTNSNDFDIKDRWNGTLYVFKKNSDVNIPYLAATHIFGVEFAGEQRDERDERIFRHLQKRWGWNNLKEEDVRLHFENLTFKVVAMSMVETIVEDKEPELSEPRIKGKPGRPVKSKEADEEEVA